MSETSWAAEGGNRLLIQPLTLPDITSIASSMDVSLSPELKKRINDKVKTGLYHTAGEVIREGLRLLEERERLYRGRLMKLRRDVKKGLDQLDRGESVPGEQVFAELRAKARERRRKPR